MEKIILASASPRRIELLRRIGIEAEVRPSHADEKIPEDHRTPREVVEELSRRKAADVAEHVKNEEDACRMLRKLSGRRNIVYTGVTILLIRGCEIAETDTFSNATCVFFYPLEEEEILAYVRSGEPMDKAGAYGIQGYCARYITGIKGDYYNVVGLPVAAVYAALSRLGCTGPET